MRRIIVGACVTIAAWIALGAETPNWPQWRGPEGTGIAAPGTYPVTFSAAEGVLWKSALPGKGCSTPLVWGECIVLTAAAGEGTNGLDCAVCFEWTTGKKLWQTELGQQRPGRHRRGSGSNPSPVTDGTRVYVYFKSGTLSALDFKGTLLWQTNLQQRYGKDSLWWDLGTSPVLAGGLLVVAVMQEGNSYVVAVDPATGNEVWKKAREYPGREETRQSYTTPLVVRAEGRDTVVIWGADHLTGNDAATGDLLWQCGGFNPENKSVWRVIASPTLERGIAVVPYGREQFVAGVRIGSNGDITATARLWEKRGMGTDGASPVAFNGKTCFVNFKGKMWCLDLETGNELWSTMLPKGKGVFYSSPVLAGDTLYLCREEGDVYVCRVKDDGLTVLNQTKFDDVFVASPVLLRNRLLLRGEKHLWCIGK